MKELFDIAVEYGEKFLDYISNFFEMIKAVPMACLNLFMSFSNFPFPFNFIFISIGLILVVIILGFLINLCYSLITFFIGGDS